MNKLKNLIEQFKIDSTYLPGKCFYSYTFNYDEFKELLNILYNRGII